jgi:mannose PTS system EIIA component
MTVGLLIITHDQIGDTLLRTAMRMLDGTPLPTKTLPVMSDVDPEKLLTKAQQLVVELDSGGGVIVFTDMYGSTPSNIAYSLMKQGSIHVIAGINLPMLIRTLNYPALSLESLTMKAISGGKEGIFCCTKPTHIYPPC